ncbi:MAG: DUF1302 family protein [Pedobacter sp.]
MRLGNFLLIACGVMTLMQLDIRSVGAFQVDSNLPDLKIDWNNTLRYNWGMRMQERDSRIADNAAYDQGDALFDRYDTITNRLDWLSELDLAYRENYGLRVTAAAWYDVAYGTHGRSNPNAMGTGASPVSYTNNEFTSYVRRYYAGPSAELLDAFVFSIFAIGDTVWNVKVGRHALVWGESLFGSAHAVSYSQSPSDGMKAISNPGASAKETALPVTQLSTITQIMPEVTLLTHIGFEWRPNRIAEGGTYFGSDGVNEGPNVNRLSAIEGKWGDVGVGLKWSPAWLDGTVGFFARRFDDKGGWLAQVVGGGQTRAVYARDIGLFGMTLAKNVGGVSVGAELSHRTDGPLTSDGAASAGPAGGYEGARGDTWHGLLNGVATLGPTMLYDSASLSTELAWSGLDRVTSNPQLYRAKGYLASCDSDATMKGCADKNFMSLAVSFVPTWLQVFPGIDLEMPLFFSKNIMGNAPTIGGGSEGFTTWKAGLTAKAYARHQFDLAYTGYEQKIQDLTGSAYGSRVLGVPYKDKGWLSFTYQVTF